MFFLNMYILFIFTTSLNKMILSGVGVWLCLCHLPVLIHYLRDNIYTELRPANSKY